MFLDSVLRHAPWSISKVGMLEKCVQQYHHKYVARTKEGRKSDESRVGVVGHKVLELALKTPGTPVEQLMLQRVEEDGLTKQESDELLAQADWAEDFLRRAADFRRDQGVTLQGVEEQVAIRHDFTDAKFFDKGVLLRGLIDLSWVTRHNVMVIVDHKFGKRKPISEHTVQFNAYRLMAVARYPVAGVQCAINYAGASRLDWTPLMTRKQILDLLPGWLVTYLNRYASKLNVIDQQKVVPETGWWCAWCGFSGVCEPGQQEIARREAKSAKQKAAKSTPNL